MNKLFTIYIIIAISALIVGGFIHAVMPQSRKQTPYYVVMVGVWNIAEAEELAYEYEKKVSMTRIMDNVYATQNSQFYIVYLVIDKQKQAIKITEELKKRNYVVEWEPRGLKE
jgi:hypothetical protein